MFVSQDTNLIKNKFQKPNILRRKPNLPMRSQVISESIESDMKLIVPNKITYELPSRCDIQNKLEKQKVTETNTLINRSVSNVQHSSKFSLINTHASKELGINNTNKITVAVISTSNTKNPERHTQRAVNEGPFVISSSMKQNLSEFGVKLENYEKLKCSVDLKEQSKETRKEQCNIIQENIYLEKKSELTSMIPLFTVSSKQNIELSTQQKETVTGLMNVPSFVFMNDTSPQKLKCDIPECNKGFSNEQKLKKHQSTHNKESSHRSPRQITFECPIKAIRKDGAEEPCGRIFIVREELVKHLNEEHTLNEANYICEECGRRFFWSSGLHAHVRAHGRARVRGALACPWPGCGRVFRQPCRLREHTRAHTGDKPYPCHYPNCGWSFRTASKLVRHARRHTGERRHTCVACGRKFLRREHLRDHSARHHTRPPVACSHQGCEQTFNNMSSLYMHMKKVHKKEKASKAIASNIVPSHITNVDKSLMVSLADTPVQYEQYGAHVHEDTREMGSETLQPHPQPQVEVAAVLEAEEHAARTHCTWPLLPRDCGYSCEDGYVLEEDVQVEQTENSENNIYTIRSDLFLHGNVLNNEDSESVVAAGGGAAEEAGLVLVPQPSLDAHLALLDAHPSLGLLQEELMYSDAVDESSFRVFLLSGEDLT